jgi:hypothetical protein
MSLKTASPALRHWPIWPPRRTSRQANDQNPTEGRPTDENPDARCQPKPTGRSPTELVGEALAPVRDQVAIATKFGFTIDPAPGSAADSTAGRNMAIWTGMSLAYMWRRRNSSPGGNRRAGTDGHRRDARPPQRHTLSRDRPPARPVRGRPWKTDGVADRSHHPDAVRCMSVDAATRRPTATQGDTRRDKAKRPA